MPETNTHASAADWQQLEAFVQQLQELAHAPLEASDFYRQLLKGCVTLMAAEGGVVWLPAGRGQWRAVEQIHGELLQGDSTTNDEAAHRVLLQKIAGTAEPQILLPQSRGATGGQNATKWVVALVAVQEHAIIELCLRPGCSPAVQQGWQELLATVSQVAGDFHLRDQLRALRAERGFYDQSLALTQRLQRTTDLRQTAFEIVNEGRRFVSCDRLSVVMRRGKRWQLLAASGVDRIEAQSDATKRLQALAAAAAAWGEPLEHLDGVPESKHELPPELSGLLEQHIDESHARRVVVVPVEVEQPEASGVSRTMAAVLVAEQFSSEAEEFSRQRALELAGICGPALGQARLLDRFPVRSCLRWAERWERSWQKWGLTKWTLAAVATAAVLAALVFVQTDFEVEAPATLMPVVERDIFATASGNVIEVCVEHGQLVEANEVLAVLHDPQLALDVERVVGEIATTGKRLEAIAIARTDRQVREDATNEKLPLSAEAEQLRKRLVSLRVQQEILADRRKSLTLRSPIAGTVLTLDVQKMLETRPVERGQVLFTVADTTAGWQLKTKMPQGQLGEVVAAQERQGVELAARFRLAGDAEQTYNGHVVSISTTAVLDTTELDQESLPFEINVAVDEEELTTARPGMNAQVRIHCGRRSLGYVWLHDIWNNLYSWWVF